MNRLGQWYFGRLQFEETEQLQEFRYKFLMVLLGFGALATGIFLALVAGNPDAIPADHVRSMRLFTAGSFLLWLGLRGRRQWFLPVAWAYELICVLEYISALAFVPGDELRILWLFTNIPGVYLLLGRLVGGVITVLTVLGLVLGNPFLSAPYSPGAVATAVVSFLFMGAFFHAYMSQMLRLFFQLRQLALRDMLTGAFNSRAFYTLGERLVANSRRSGRPFAVLFVDLDHFKTINDTWGHEAGDAVLRSVAQCLSAGVREGDLVGRIGGEEFSVFLPETDLEGARILGERLRLAIELLRPMAGGQPLPVTASIGVAAYGHGGRADGTPSLRDIQREADQALYEAKRGGRNRVSVFGDPAAAALA